jgi:hypothetical protein
VTTDDAVGKEGLARSGVYVDGSYDVRS